VAKDVRAGVAMYGADGKVTGYKSSKSFALTDEKAQVTLSSDKLKNAAKAKLFIYDGEKALRPLAESQELF
jgi:hypothetical protein